MSSIHPLDDNKDKVCLRPLRRFPFRYKVWGPYVLTLIDDWTPICTWYMASLELQMDVKRTCVMMRLESMCLKYIDTILGSMMNTLGKAYVIIQRVRESSLRPPISFALQLRF